MKYSLAFALVMMFSVNSVNAQSHSHGLPRHTFPSYQPYYNGWGVQNGYSYNPYTGVNTTRGYSSNFQYHNGYSRGYGHSQSLYNGTRGYPGTYFNSNNYILRGYFD